MSGDVLPLLWLTLMLAAVTWLLSSLAVLVITRRPVHEFHDPVGRSRRLLLIASMPWLLPVTVGAAVLAAAGSKTLGWIADHCLHHGVGHPHLCFSHLPAMDLGLLHGILATAFAVPLAFGLTRLSWAEYQAARRLAALKTLASSRGRLRILPASAPFALAGGAFAPVVLLSRGLLSKLSFRERRIVVAHEAAHLRHGDLRRSVLLEMLLLLHLPVVRRRLRTAWLRAAEERADDAAARRFGAERVVETLLHVARLKLHRPVPGFSVAGAHLIHRAQRLLHGGGRPVGWWFESAYAVGLASLFTAAVVGHHTLETLLGVIAGL